MRLIVGQLRVAFAAGMQLACLTSSAGGQASSQSAWQEVAKVLQTTDAFAGGYHRYNLPRSDLTLRKGDVTVASALALGAWAGFSGDPANATMMGDLVLTTAELKPVLAALAQQNLDVTAVHNHIDGDSPSLTYVHFHGEGDAVGLARRLNAAVALTGTPRPVATSKPGPVTIDTAVVFRTLGTAGRGQGAVAQVSFILVPGTVTMHGQVVTPALGYGSPVNIQMVGPGRAVATGDFAITGAQVQPMARALALHGITVTALHSHLVGDEPHLYYMHFWADGALPDVLAGLRAALDAAK